MICEEWRSNPDINPVTKRRIKIGGSVYKKLQKECDKPNRPVMSSCKSRKLLTTLNCDDWKLNPGINPVTGKQIIIGKSVYNKIKKDCTIEPESDLLAKQRWRTSYKSLENYVATEDTNKPTNLYSSPYNNSNMSRNSMLLPYLSSTSSTKSSKPPVLIPAHVVLERYGLNVALSPEQFAKLQQIHHRYHQLSRTKLADDLGVVLP